MSAGLARTFHGLNGAEIRIAFLTEIKSQLMERIQPYWATKIHIDFVYQMALESYPAGDRHPKASVSGSVQGTGAECAVGILARIKNHYDRDTDFGQHITFPKVTWAQTLQLKAHALPETDQAPPAAAPAGPGEIDLRATAPAKVVTTADSMAARIAALEAENARLRAGQQPPAETPGKVVSFDGRVPPRVQSLELFGKTGRPDADTPQQEIVGGAKVSPGPEHAESNGRSALTSLVRDDTTLLESMTIGIEHPPLTEGGAGHPDAIRRATNQPQPTPTRVLGSGIVDFTL